MPRALPPFALSCAAIACLATACARDHAPARQAVAPASAPSGTAGPDAAPADEPDNQGGTRLTIYSGDYEQLSAAGVREEHAPGYVLVERTLRYALKQGQNRIDASGVPRAMDVEAVSLRPLQAGFGIQSQRFVAPPSGSADVLAGAAGRKVTVEHTSGGAKQTDTGILVSADGGLTLALGDGRIKVIRQFDSFSLVDAAGSLPQQAALQWTVQAPRAGDAAFELSYPMGGMAWRAEYLARLQPGEDCRLDLDGAALVANRSGSGFDDARLTLVAGEPRRSAPRVQRGMMREQAADAVAYAAPQSMPAERTSGEYHAYELPGAFDIADGSTERVPLFAARSGVACRRAYETAPADAPWLPPQPMIDPGFNDQAGEQPVNAVVALVNDKAAGLDRPLPEGRVRVFDGRDFLGEASLAHTPKGADIRLEVGTAFDLTARRERTAFRVDRAGRTMTESFAIVLKNAKDAPATVTVVEPVPRWSDWDIAESSVPARKRDAQRAEFAVEVPANGEARLTYTARYRWAPGVRP